MNEQQTERKHRIAVVSNAWSSEFLSAALEGVREEAERDASDLFIFVTYNLVGASPGQNNSPLQLFDLIDPQEYDGFILFSNTFNIPEEHESVQRLMKRAHIPFVSTEVREPGASLVGTSNYKGIYDLSCHLIEEHGVKSVVYVSGYEGNEESNIRRQALEDALHEHGLTLTDVMPGDFGFYRSSVETEKWLEEGRPIPDAFVCANDHMAMALISTLHHHGIDVPGDVLVTGFDQIHEAQTSYPLVATVARGWREMGALAYREVVRQIGNPDPSFEKITDSHFVPSESCGCRPDADAVELRLEKMRNLYAESNDTNMVEFFFQEIRVAMAKVESKEEFHETAKTTLGKRRFFGKDYCICTEPLFFEVEDDELLMQSAGFSDRMDVLYESRANETAPLRTYQLDEVYPGYTQVPGESHVYVVSPMNNSGLLVGYIAIKDYPGILYDLRFKRWINNLETLLINIRQYIFAQRANRKLREIYMTDFLTGMYNRTGCDAVLFPRIKEEKEAGHEMVLLFADINCMKVINDDYGHLNGDLAIKATAQALMKALPDSWLFCRYGGDEFIAVGRKRPDRSIEDYRTRFNEELSKIVKRLKANFYLSASLGYYFIKPDDTGEIEDFIHKADASMYEEKERAHQKIREMGMNADPA